MSPIGSYVGGLTSKGQVGVLLWEHRGWILRMASLIKIEKQHITVIPSDSHSGFYFPPFVETNGPPFSPEREMFRKLSFAPTYKTLLSTRQTAVAICRLSDFGRSTQACFPLFTHRGINYPPTSSVHPFSPERKTCYMLFISEAIAFLLSLSFSSSVILSFVPTYRNQLSPI